MKRTVATISDATIKDRRTITVNGWTGRLTAVTACNGRYKLRIALDGGADLTTGWLDADTAVDIEGRRSERAHRQVRHLRRHMHIHQDATRVRRLPSATTGRRVLVTRRPRGWRVAAHRSRRRTPVAPRRRAQAEAAQEGRPVRHRRRLLPPPAPHQDDAVQAVPTSTRTRPGVACGEVTAGGRMTPTTRTVDSDSASVARADGGADRVESGRQNKRVPAAFLAVSNGDSDRRMERRS